MSQSYNDSEKIEITFNEHLLKLKKTLFYLIAIILFLQIIVFILSFNYLQNNVLFIFSISILFFIIIFSLFLIYKSTKLIKMFIFQIKFDFIEPLMRLNSILQMIKSHKLDLLPEEKNTVFTYSMYKSTVEIAEGIIDHQRFIDQIVDNMFEMLFKLDKDGIILQTNKSALDTLKYNKSEIIGQHFRRITPISDKYFDVYAKMECELVLYGCARDFEYHIITSEGEVLPHTINAIRVEGSNNELLGYTIIAKNISDEARLLNQLTRSHNELDFANEELEKRYDQIKKEIEVKEYERRLMEHELATSQLVQKTFLPQGFYEHNLISFFGSSEPAVYSGGDWWNTIALNDKFYVFIGDVTGHGTASAMVTAAISGCFTLISAQIKLGILKSVNNILQDFNRVLASMSSHNAKYNMTCFACEFNFTTMTMKFANAGHNFPMIIRKNKKKAEALVVSGNRLGEDNNINFIEKEVSFDKGDFIFFYTDGLIENKNTEDEQFGKKRLRQFLEANYNIECELFIKKMYENFTNFIGSNTTLEDDVTMVAIKITDAIQEDL